MGDKYPPFYLIMDKKKLPRHVAIIMDGNGRWAQARGMSRTQGHLEGVKRVEEIIKAARDIGIEFLTIFAFSKEKWSRPKE
jgi:undecaprenyl diphosphate synthase